MTKELVNPRAQELLTKSQERAKEFFTKTTELIGLLSVGSAIACIGTENPQFYAWITGVFTVVFWIVSFWPYRRQLKMLESLGYRDMQKWAVIRRCTVALAGWFFLMLVANGFFDTKGFNAHPTALVIRKS